MLRQQGTILYRRTGSLSGANNLDIQDIQFTIEQVALPGVYAYQTEDDQDHIRFNVAEYNISSMQLAKLFKSLPGDIFTKFGKVGIRIADNDPIFAGPAIPLDLFPSSFWVKTWLICGFVIYLAMIVLLIFFANGLLRDRIVVGSLAANEEASYSLNKTLTYFWTIIIIGSFIYVWGLTGELGVFSNTSTILLGLFTLDSM